ncbi:PTS system lactose/cellobiose-specific IIA component [Spiroplasma syrphidicola EA-1]|uniref:PTS system lactose/cellobiose-specific IIA component n=1 Tax=Spiroplasma syrphidicola EA-1 TaxID=1276229 RepID=R4U2U6_9MOLU|nr:PTS lactose/cellobiose transporter subunit IIA [Spiroplasma syrphidicola]AGM25697.1 PTS system lactose/cellobiose-specific IIA component [Spiroplasma syrphidicola EA-1]
MEKLNFEEISFGIITYAGMAKSNALIAITTAKTGNITEAEKLITEAEEHIITAEKTHMSVIQQEAQGVKHQIPVLFMHAEDQMMSAQMVIELAKEFISLYQILKTKNLLD